MNFGCGRRHEAKARCQQPGDARAQDKSDTRHEHDDSEDQHGHVEISTGVAQKQQAGSEQHEHDADLQRSEHAGDGVGHALAVFEIHSDRSSFEEAPASVCLHVGGELLVRAELVDEAAVHFRLQLEDATPATVFDKETDHPREDGEKAKEREQRPEVMQEFLEGARPVLLPIDVGPDGAFKDFVGFARFVGQMREEEVFGIARDLGVHGEECGELRVVACDVVLISEQRRIVGDDRGERGAEAQEADELDLGRGDVFVVEDRRGRRWRGGMRLCDEQGAGEREYCRSEESADDGSAVGHVLILEPMRFCGINGSRRTLVNNMIESDY